MTNQNVSVKTLGKGRFEVLIELPDCLGLLSVITGLFASNRISILHADIRTTHKIAKDRFDVQCEGEPHWEHFRQDLLSFSKKLRTGQSEEVFLEINRRIIRFLRGYKEKSKRRLRPIQLEVNTEVSPYETVVDIRAVDTPAFLYEVTNALSLLEINIVRMDVKTVKNQVVDRLWLTTADGAKIDSENKIKALHWAVLLMKQFTHLLPKVPDPARALKQIAQFGKDVFFREDFQEVLLTLRESETLEDLSQVLGSSQFLWEEFLRTQHESIFPILSNHEILKLRKEPSRIRKELEQILSPLQSFEEKVKELNTYKDREIFRIDMRHILRRTSFVGEFAWEFTDLAEVVVNSACEIVWEEILKKYPHPKVSEKEKSELAVFALGKFGGRELGYASDLEVFFVYSDDPESSSALSQQNLKFYTEFVRLFRKTIHAREEGVFEIDLRLRPHGNSGPLASSIDLFRDYYLSGSSALNFERQALVKLRPIGGSEKIAEEVLHIRDAFVYGEQPFDFQDALHVRDRQRKELVQKGTINAKYSAGGLLDVEYLVQTLQIVYGRRIQGEVRDSYTLKALRALWKTGVLEEDQFQALRASYIFLRCLINGLRIERGNAKDLTIPEWETEEFTILARRIGLTEGDDDVVREKFKRICIKHMQMAHELYKHWMKKLASESWETLPGQIQVRSREILRIPFDELFHSELSSHGKNILTHLGFRDMKKTVARLRRLCPHPLLFEPFALAIDRAWTLWPSIPDPDLAVMHLEQHLEYLRDKEGFWESLALSKKGLSILLTVFGSSRYLSELLIRNPEYWDWVRDPWKSQLKVARQSMRETFQQKSVTFEDLQKVRHRETFRIVLAETIHRAPLENVYKTFSDLADGVLGQLLQSVSKHNGLSLIGLGKLGGRELNYSSDVDVLFVATPSQEERALENSVRRFLNLSKRGDFTEFLYRTDLRLRPHGEGGSFFLKPDEYRQYYEKEAAPWEHQALMKARFVSGNREVVEKLLMSLEHLIYREKWDTDALESIREVKRRYETMTRSKGEEDTNIKLMPGGIRDIEFSIQMLQLLHGFKNPSLRKNNIFESFEEIRRKNLLEEKDFHTLLDGYVFLRRVENRLHIYENRQEFNLPNDPKGKRFLARCLGFYGNETQSAEDQLAAETSRHRQGCREIFERIFYKRK